MTPEDDGEAAWRALADPTRRRILDLLAERPRTTGELCAQFPDLSRFAVMKHLDVLEETSLVLVRREGRVRWNHFNAIPIQRIYERWIRPKLGGMASALLRLGREAERPEEP